MVRKSYQEIGIFLHAPVLKGFGERSRRWSFILGIKFFQIAKVNNYNGFECILINSSRNFYVPILPLIRIPGKFKTNWSKPRYKHSWLAKHYLNVNLVFIQTLQNFYFQWPFISTNKKIKKAKPTKKKVSCIFLHFSIFHYFNFVIYFCISISIRN